MNISIRNTTSMTIDQEKLTDILDKLIESLEPNQDDLSIAFVDDETMKDLHEDYYGEDGTTDVLTFNYDTDTVEIVLNPFEQRRQAESANIALSEEVARNLVHGFLHGQGFDHTSDDGEHLQKQNDLMNQLGELKNNIVTTVEYN